MSNEVFHNSLIIISPCCENCVVENQIITEVVINFFHYINFC